MIVCCKSIVVVVVRATLVTGNICSLTDSLTITDRISYVHISIGHLINYVCAMAVSAILSLVAEVACSD